MNEYLMIGEVLKPQGVRGEVKIKPYAADLEAFHDWKTLYLLDGTVYQPIKASCSRVHDGFAYVTLGDCKTMDDAEKLRGQKLYIDRAHALSLADDEVYISDLIGCAAVDETGASLGKLTDVPPARCGGRVRFPVRQGRMDGTGAQSGFPGGGRAEPHHPRRARKTGRGGRLQ